ncbi:cytosolic phospholipase A2 epsilon-like isoform X2 [Rhineura floridana]|uniref:cytosolic phospholipase A2 epsilon-like isoform X2 n=1 Tax=Rhineura floridana TaxID=261503 RepID=UPI002AC7F6B6|nr:cytosolic phospholipase A2 epsilon-like isoform X2 [Rhineura floridana]
MFQEHLPSELPVVAHALNVTTTAACCSSSCRDFSINAYPVESIENEPGNLWNEVHCNSQSKMETFPCNLLTVRVIRMRNLRQADVLSQSDCYVTLWLPTAACEKLKTKTINNCKNPVWNETFYYRIQSQVKNVLELSVFDEDAITADDHLFTICFDVARLPIGERVLMYFKSEPQEQEELEVEFLVEPASGPPETIITNGVLVCREVCRLEAEVNQEKPHKSKKNLSLSLKGSCEGTHCFKLGSDAIVSPPCPTAFHYVKYKDPVLDVMLPPKKSRCNLSTCCYSTKGDVPPVMLNSLPMGEKVPIVEEKKYDLHVKVDDCHYSCPADLDVRLGYDLCPQEQEFLYKRKRRVAQALKQVLQLDYDLQDHEVPVVAVMTTGGGTRSFTTTYGSITGLKKLNILDCVTYISCLSGTSWAMAHLYRDAYWSQKDLDEKINEAKKQVTKSKIEMFTMERTKYYYQQLRQRKQEGHKTTFIDLWGLIIEYLLNDGKDNHRLSEQREALIDGQNPLPVYVTINIKDKYSTHDFKEWLEFTPFEAGFLKYGAFVHPENFGSEFFMGRLIKKLPESRMCYLHGMWSSIFSLNLLYIWNTVNNSEEFWHRWTRDKIIDIEEEPDLTTKPYDIRSHMFIPAGDLANMIRGALTDRLSVAQYHNFLKGFQMHNYYLENERFHRWKATVLDHRPNQLMEHGDHLGLVDAGFFINTSCPPLLRPERKVDVIVHLSYSAGSQTLPLEQACKYYREQGIPFPNVVLTEQDRKELRECYYFNQSEVSGCPILLFFPLVNDTFRYYKAPGEKRCCEAEMAAGNVDVSTCKTPYSTYCLRYSDENFDKLVNLCEYNILNNEHLILQALHAAVEQKRQHCCKN